MRRFWLCLLLTGLLIGITPVLAQDETPEATSEIEATVETEVTVEPETTAEPEATAEPPSRFELPGPGSYNVRQDFSTEQREFVIDIPQSYREDGDPMPLVLVLHGAGGNGNGIRGVTRISELGEVEGFISVFPSGINGGWNDGRPDPGLQALNDIAYFNQLISLLTNSLNLDEERIYSTGFSMGGMMSYRLGCNLPQIAAVVSVASPMPAYILQECDASPPLPVLLIQGTDDHVVPWMGSRGGYLSASNTMQYWTQQNGCTYETELVIEPDVDPNDFTLVIREQYDDCAAEVMMYGIYRGGHTWPQGVVRVPMGAGLTSRDINGSEVIWAYLQRQSLSDRQPLEAGE